MATIRGARALFTVGVLAVVFGGIPMPAVAAAAAAAPNLVAPAPAAALAAHTFAYKLGEAGDFVTQYTAVACVGASIQMMLNVINPGADRTAVTQVALLRLAQQRSNRAWVKRSGGASAMGWAWALTQSGGGGYEVRAYSTRADALTGVVEAIRTTGRPAGLLVWQGVHAWVVTGFHSTADPAHGRYSLTDLIIDDPWWPRPTNSHGATVAPGSWLTSGQVAANFVPYRRGHPGFGSEMNGAYVVVLPVDPVSRPRLGPRPV